MGPTEEQRFLRAALAYLERGEGKRSWRLILLDTSATASLAVIAYWVFAQPGDTNWRVVLFLVLAFASGLALGGLALWRSVAHNGNLIAPYIDRDRMRTRLDELDA